MPHRRPAIMAWIVTAVVIVSSTRPVGGSPLPSPLSAAHYSCAGCHRSGAANETGATSEAARIAPPTSEANAERAGTTVPCRRCHAALLEPQAASANLAHRALECQACHEPHKNDLPFHFRRDLIQTSAARESFDAETRLCVSCHFQTGEFEGCGGGFIRHPVGITVAQHDKHVVSVATEAELVNLSPTPDDVALPLLPRSSHAANSETVIGCATCHSFHGNWNPFLLRWNRDQEITACLSCHPSVVDPVADEYPGAALAR